jgi:hypothetical protein
MDDELSLWHGGKNGFNDCRIDVIHNLFKKGGMWNSKEASFNKSHEPYFDT